MFERLGERIDDGAVFDQTFDHPMLAGIVDMDYADVTELAVDIADAGDGGAVVGLATHQDNITRLKRQRGAVPVIGVVDQSIVITSREAPQRVAALCKRMAARYFPQHIGDVAQDAENIAEALRHLGRHQTQHLVMGKLTP